MNNDLLYWYKHDRQSGRYKNSPGLELHDLELVIESLHGLWIGNEYQTLSRRKRQLQRRVEGADSRWQVGVRRGRPTKPQAEQVKFLDQVQHINSIIDDACRCKWEKSNDNR